MLWEFRIHLPVIQAGVLAIAVAAHMVVTQTKIALLPSPVAEAVEARFPGASWRGVKTEHDGGQTVHEVSLRHDGKFFSLSLTPAGEFVEVERSIPRSGLPPAVRVALGKTRFDTVTSVEEVRVGDAVGYEVRHRSRGWGDAKVTFDPAGNVVRVPQR